MVLSEEDICADKPIVYQSNATFSSADYVIFAGMLLLSSLIGIYFAWKDRKKGSEEYMMGKYCEPN